MKKVFFVAIGLLGMAIASCSKDDDDNVTPPPPPEEEPTAMDLITNHTWRIDTIGFDTDLNGSIDNGATIDECGKDNTLTFADNSTGVFSEGALKCDANEPDTTPFTWNFQANDSTVITITGDLANLEGDVDIQTLTDSTLVLSKLQTTTNTNLVVALKK